MHKVQDVTTPPTLDKMVNFISAMGQMIPCNPPLLPSECKCSRCGRADNGMTCRVNAQSGDGPVMWFCCNQDCLNYNIETMPAFGDKVVPMPRAVEWPKFCERYEIPTQFHKIKFEGLVHYHKSDAIADMRNYAHKPTSFGWFKGDAGTGKTCACYAILELFLRERTSAAFYTGEGLMEKWLDDAKSQVPNLKHKLREVELLVIDDFAQRDPPQGFMAFLFNLMDHRMGWERGTLITTNMGDAEMRALCGEPLIDRLSTATLKKKFTGASLRGK